MKSQMYRGGELSLKDQSAGGENSGRAGRKSRSMRAGDRVCLVNETQDESERVRDPLLLDNQLCYALYAAAHRMTKSYRPLLERIGLTYPQYLVLLVLWEQDAVTVSEIGRRLRLDSGTLTPVLKRLETAGLLVRNRRHTDEREVEIALTTRGVAIRAEAVVVRESVMCQLDLDEPGMRSLRADLNRLVERLSERD